MAQQTDHIGDTNKMVTAVEWLIEQISEKQPNGLYVIDTLEDVKRVFEQAKEMEKEQMKGMYVEGGFAQMRYFDGKEFITGEQYYNENYNK